MIGYVRKTSFEPPARDRRRWEPFPPAKKLPAKAYGRKRPPRNYGYTYTYTSPWMRKKFADVTRWYETPEQRDQAMAAFARNSVRQYPNFYRLVGAVDRGVSAN